MVEARGERGNIIIVSNDVVPGLGLPVAAPGLRVFGLSEGLKAHGFRVTTVVSRDFVDRQWERRGQAVPHPTASGIEFLKMGKLFEYLKSNAPAIVILINGNQVDTLSPIPGIKFVLDFFAPKILETLYQYGDEYPTEQLETIKRRKIKAIGLSDAFIVNGSKKVPYFIGWMVQAGRDIRGLPIETVNMCVPLRFGSEDKLDTGRIRLALAGYLQSWSVLGEWLEVLEQSLDGQRITLDMLVSWHWSRADWNHVSSGDLERLASHPSVTSHSPMSFSRFQEFLTGIDVTVDLFKRNLEREYAMVTRAVISLACGVPVIHPPFTEVSKMIRDYDAGWLVDPADLAEVRGIFERVTASPEEVRAKKENARRLASEVLDPQVAVRPLVKTIEASL
jgi:hypothetical protein